jgi:methionyl-tRNA synthetase
MSSNLNKFYVTTPIYYVTAKPHLGSLYSTVLADISARFHKLLGQELFFLTGTDEHGQKIAQAAEIAGQHPKLFVDSFAPRYQETWKNYQIEYSKFIRTTDQYHVKAVQVWLQNLINLGDIYKSHYQGWYCTPDETFITEKEYESGAQQVNCPACGRETQFVSEESYFFRLSNYQAKLLDFYKQNPDFIIPKEKINEVIRFVESGLKDLCISRSTINWGIPFPGDSKHVTYVWADALNNYITAIGYGDKDRDLEFAKWWPADLQILGKDILRFHAIYWPAFLMASNLPLPKRLLVHGWIKIGNQKMSKSLGNVVDPDILYKEYGSDQIRYYLASSLAITHDSNFDLNILRETLTADLANNLGNLLSRATSLALKHNLTNIIKPNSFDIRSQEIIALIKATSQDYTKLMQDCSYHMSIGQVNRLIARVNAYFHELEPWVLAKTNQELFKEVIWVTCAVLEAAAILFWPVMPNKMQELASRIGSTKLNQIYQQPVPGQINLILEIITGKISQAFNLQAGPVLFVKYEKLELLEPIKTEELKVSESLSNYIDFEDFLKVELIVGTIEQCEHVLGSEKLLKLMVNFGDHGIKQVLSGIAKFYSPSDMIGKQGVFVFNLKPRKIMGYESNGMLLSVPDQDQLKLVSISGAVPNGSRLG